MRTKVHMSHVLAEKVNSARTDDYQWQEAFLERLLANTDALPEDKEKLLPLLIPSDESVYQFNLSDQDVEQLDEIGHDLSRKGINKQLCKRAAVLRALIGLL